MAGRIPPRPNAWTDEVRKEMDRRHESWKRKGPLPDQGVLGFMSEPDEGDASVNRAYVERLKAHKRPIPGDRK